MYHVKEFFNVFDYGIGVLFVVEDVVGTAVNNYRFGSNGINESFNHIFPVGCGGCAYTHGNCVFTAVSRIEIGPESRVEEGVAHKQDSALFSTEIFPIGKSGLNLVFKVQGISHMVLAVEVGNFNRDFGSKILRYGGHFHVCGSGKISSSFYLVAVLDGDLALISGFNRISHLLGKLGFRERCA